MDRKFVLEYVRVTEAAAIACSTLTGKGKKNDADALAVGAMRRGFDRVPVRGTVVIGEGEMDEAPMLYIGEQVGPDRADLPEFDIAVDPLEGTTLCAKDRPGAIAVLAVANRGDLLHAPDMYMDKIAAGPAGRGVVGLDKSPGDNVRALAEALGKRPDDVGVVVLDRPRHAELVEGLREAGARVTLITDGDVAPAVAAGLPGTGVDMLMGIGGAPEGVLAAAALRCLGGEFQGRLHFTEDGERERVVSMGIADPDHLFERDEIVRGDCLFVASGVTTGPFLRGVRYEDGWFHVHSVALRSDSGTIRYVETATKATHLNLPEDARVARGG
jgi:fructose-1,6-bisphosphatase II